jgi:hypothetical protein
MQLWVRLTATNIGNRWSGSGAGPTVVQAHAASCRSLAARPLRLRTWYLLTAN